MRVLLAAGGSGGHINPALAMAQMIAKTDTSAFLAFAGRPASMEEGIIKKEGYPFYGICIEGLQRKFSCRNLRSVFLAISSPKKAKNILKEMRADLVIGTGGYVSYPFIKAAHALKIPSLLFEANATPGLCVRLCEKMATRTLLQFEECLPHMRFPSKARVIGAPLREDFYTVTREKARMALGIPQNVFFFLSFGGSLGAAQINRACIEVLEKHKNKKDLLHIHGCGERYFEELAKKHPSLVETGRLLPYVEKMPLYMSAADLVLCRAGAITLAEIARLGRAAILVPSPNVSGDHQRINAYAYQKRNAAWVMEEKYLTGASLSGKLFSLMKNQGNIRSAEREVKQFDVSETPQLFRTVLDALNTP